MSFYTYLAKEVKIVLIYRKSKVQPKTLFHYFPISEFLSVAVSSVDKQVSINVAEKDVNISNKSFQFSAVIFIIYKRQRI